MSLITLMEYFEKCGSGDSALQQALQVLAQIIEENKTLRTRKTELFQDQERLLLELDTLETIYEQRVEEQADALKTSEMARGAYVDVLGLRMNIERLVMPKLSIHEVQLHQLQKQQEITELERECAQNMRIQELMEARGVVQDLRQCQREHFAAVQEIAEAEDKAKETLVCAQRKLHETMQVRNHKILKLVQLAKQLQTLLSVLVEGQPAVEGLGEQPTVVQIAATPSATMRNFAPLNFLSFLAEFQANKENFFQITSADVAYSVPPTTAAASPSTTTVTAPLRSILCKPLETNADIAAIEISPQKHVTFQLQETTPIDSTEGYESADDIDSVPSSQSTVASDNEVSVSESENSDATEASSTMQQPKQSANEVVIIENHLIQSAVTPVPAHKEKAKSNDVFAELMQSSDEQQQFALGTEQQMSTDGFGGFFANATFEFNSGGDNSQQQQQEILTDGDAFFDIFDSNTQHNEDNNFL